MSMPFGLDDYEQYARNNPFMYYNHIELCSVSPERSVVKLTLAEESRNLHGTVHGGLIYAMADCVAGITARAEGRDYVTQSAHMNFLGNVKDGDVFSDATVVKRGRRQVILHVRVYTAGEKLLADGVVDMFAAE